MYKILFLLALSWFFVVPAGAEEATDEPSEQPAEPTTTEQDEPTSDASEPVDPGGPKTMSGMSILGNEETPKSLVIVPWKSSELGDGITFSDTLAERARPVDKEVFMRELEYFEIRSEK